MGDAGYYYSASDILAKDFTVVNYDRRCNSRSTGDRTIDMIIAQQAQDVAAIISDMGFDKAIVFGNIGDGNIPLELAATRSDLISFLIVHEVSLIEILPDAKKWSLFNNNIYIKSQKEGWKAALGEFKDLINVPDIPFPVDLKKRVSGNIDFFFKHEFKSFISYIRDFKCIKKNDVDMGDCEAVSSSSTKQSHCPNGSHKSPSSDCESVTGDTSTDTSSSSNSINNNPSVFNSPTQQSNQLQNNFVVPSNTTSNSNTALSSSMPLTPVNNAPLLNASTSGKCDQSLWNHVYHPERLQIVDSCKSVLGKIESKKSEADGDFHIRVRLDPQFSNLINSASINGQLGDLVVEPICQHSITQADVIPACSNFHQNINIPEVGSHVNVTGSYVLDKEHDGWAEMHPVTGIIKIH
jgi:hypothetical protein